MTEGSTEREMRYRHAYQPDRFLQRVDGTHHRQAGINEHWCSPHPASRSTQSGSEHCWLQWNSRDLPFPRRDHRRHSLSNPKRPGFIAGGSYHAAALAVDNSYRTTGEPRIIPLLHMGRSSKSYDNTSERRVNARRARQRQSFPRRFSQPASQNSSKCDSPTTLKWTT